MKKVFLTAICLVLLVSFSSFAADTVDTGTKKVEEKSVKWVDITKKVLGNPADKGGWTEDPKGKIFRSEDGNWIKIIHSSFGQFIVNLSEKTVEKVEGDKKTKIDNPMLLQRDFGTSLVVKTSDHKLRLKFTEAVSGMKHIEGIKGM